jgi:membrane-associated phospholipid phosphatase
MASSTLAVGSIDRARPHSTSSLIRRLFAGLGPLLLLYAIYSVIRYLVADRGPALGLANADSIIDLEQRDGIFWEKGLQTATLSHHWFVRAANWYYVLGFLPMLVGGAVLAAWRAPRALFHWRGVFALSLLMAIVGYTLFPLTPPRLLPNDWGFVDTLTIYGPQYYGDHRGESLFNGYGALPNMVNVYAAMPSMHVAWSVIAGALLAASLARYRWAPSLMFIHPTLMAVAVVVTANHYLLDVIAGLIVLALATVAVRSYEHRAVRRVDAVDSQSNAIPSASMGD